jgi:putative ABC transport system ATP-binding protein
MNYHISYVEAKVTQNDESMVYAEGLEKVYKIDSLKIEVLKNLTLSVSKAKFITICGPSGSGKTTLLNIIGGIDRPTGGKIFVAGQDLANKNEDFLSEFRCQNIGFVFQAYNLVSTLTMAENVAFPMEWIRMPDCKIEKRVEELLETVGLLERANHFPSQLSGGEQQRVAFARALANDPVLILADEPTGNLDIKNAQKIIEVLRILKERGKTVIIATHDSKITELADQVLYIEDGRLASKNE